MTTHLTVIPQPAVVSPDQQQQPLSSIYSDDVYTNFNDDDDNEHDDFLKRLYDDVMEGACQTVLCHAKLEEQLDFFTNCQQPVNFLMLFHHHHHHPSDAHLSSQDFADDALLPGAYVLPVFCEYCGASCTSLCDAQTCTRPRLFFAKRKPPFCKPDVTKWDPVTEAAIIVEESTLPTVESLAAKPLKKSPSSTTNTTTTSTTVDDSTRSASSPVESDVLSASASWVSGLFGMTD